MARKQAKEPASPRTGTVIAAGDRIKSLRAQKGMTQAELAKKCGVSTNTIASLEAGRPAFPYSVRAVAEALGTTYEAIRLDPSATDSAGSQATTGKVDLACVDFVTPGSLEQLDQTDPLIELITRLMQEARITYPVVVIRVAEGKSIVITIELPEDDVGKLAIAFADKKLDPLQISTIILPNTRRVEKALVWHVLSLRNAIRLRYLARWWHILMTAYARAHHVAASISTEGQADALLSYLVKRSPPTVTLNWTTDYRIILQRRDDNAANSPS